MAFGAPDDDEQQPDQLTALLAGMRGSADDQAAATQAPVAAPQAPPVQAATQAPATAPQTQPAPASPPQEAQPSQAPAIVLPVAPQAPTLDQAKYQALDNTVQQYAPGTVKASDYKPKWYDRLAGGLVGFGEGYSGNVAGGIRDGGRITTHRYDEAEADRSAKEQAAQQAENSFEHQYDMSRKGYEDQVSNFGNQMQVAGAKQGQANADRSFQFSTDNAKREQGNVDRDYNRATSNDTYQHGRDDKNDTSDHDYRTSDLNERIRHDKAMEGQEGARLNFEMNGGAKTPQDKAMKDYNTLLNQRDTEYANQQKQVDKAKADIDKNVDLRPQEKQQQKAVVDAQMGDWMRGKQGEWNQRLSAADPQGKISALMNRKPAPQGGPQQPAQQAQGGAPPRQASNGKVVSLAKAMSLPANKGKSAAQVRNDITNHGYTVGE